MNTLLPTSSIHTLETGDHVKGVYHGIPYSGVILSHRPHTMAHQIEMFFVDLNTPIVVYGDTREDVIIHASDDPGAQLRFNRTIVQTIMKEDTTDPRRTKSEGNADPDANAPMGPSCQDAQVEPKAPERGKKARGLRLEEPTLAKRFGPTPSFDKWKQSKPKVTLPKKPATKNECAADTINGVDIDKELAPQQKEKVGWPGDSNLAHDPSLSKANKTFEHTVGFTDLITGKVKRPPVRKEGDPVITTIVDPKSNPLKNDPRALQSLAKSESLASEPSEGDAIRKLNGDEANIKESGRGFGLTFGQFGKSLAPCDCKNPKTGFLFGRSTCERCGGILPKNLKEAFSTRPDCQQCHKALTDKERGAGTLCNKCVKGNKGKLYDLKEASEISAKVAWAHEKRYYAPTEYTSGFFDAVDGVPEKALGVFGSSNARVSYMAGYEAGLSFVERRKGLDESNGQPGQFVPGRPNPKCKECSGTGYNRKSIYGGRTHTQVQCSCTKGQYKPYHKLDQSRWNESLEYADNDTTPRSDNASARFDLKKNATVARSEGTVKETDAAGTSYSIPANNNLGPGTPSSKPRGTKHGELGKEIGEGTGTGAEPTMRISRFKNYKKEN